ncbi:MAG: glycosyl transferase family 1 [Planctomycetaceae bacterium]|nr:glycosyl transferase family 1 [Planctomycetaceae bacterium]
MTAAAPQSAPAAPPHEQAAQASDRPRLRVIEVIESANAGVARHTLDLSAGLARRGCEVHLVYSPLRTDRLFEDGLAALRDEPRIVATPLPIRRSIGPSDAGAIRHLRRYLRTYGPFDVLHGQSSKGGAVGRIAARLSGVPAVYTPHAMGTMNPGISGKARIAVGTIERWLSRIGTRVIALSPEERRHLCDVGINPKRIAYIPNGIAPVALPSREQAREALDLPLDAPVVGFIGRFSHQKAVDVLLDAFARVRRDRPDALLAIIGWGDLESQLRKQAEALGVSAGVRWLGPQPGLASMPAFDLFALPSRYEGLPYVLLEALVSGTPMVVTDKSSPGLVVEEGVNGLVAPVEDPAALATAISRVLGDHDLRAKFRENARRKAADFSLDGMVDDTLALYREVAGQRRRRPR